VHIRHDADDFHGLRAGANQDSLADGIQSVWISRPQPPRKALIDHHDGRCGGDISGRELPASPWWNFKRAEIIRGDQLDDPEQPLASNLRRSNRDHVPP